MNERYIKFLKQQLDFAKSKDIDFLGRGVIPENELLAWFNNLSQADKVYVSFIIHLTINSFMPVGKTREQLNES